MLISPHSASTVAAENGLITDLFIDNLRRWLAGPPLRNVYDRTAGYCQTGPTKGRERMAMTEARLPGRGGRRGRWAQRRTSPAGSGTRGRRSSRWPTSTPAALAAAAAEFAVPRTTPTTASCSTTRTST